MNRREEAGLHLGGEFLPGTNDQQQVWREAQRSAGTGAGSAQKTADSYGKIAVGGAIPKLQITIALNDAYVEPAIAAIIAGARTGRVGDGKIFIVPLDQVIRIRTGDRGGSAI